MCNAAPTEAVLHAAILDSICLNQMHWTKSRLSKMYPDPTCDHCKGRPYNQYTPVCPGPAQRLSKVFEILLEIFQIQIEPCPWVALFGLTPPSMMPTKTKSDCQYLYRLYCLQDVSYFLKWKSTILP